MFIDETAASIKIARCYVRSPRGSRCRASVPHGHWKTTTFVGALRLEGMTAPMVLDGAMHAAALLAYVEQLPVPTPEPGDILVMPICLPTNRPPSDRERLAKLRFLPPYSPDLNPIAMPVAKIKAFLKRIAARTIDDFWQAIARAVNIFTPTECRNFFTAASYEPE